MRQRLIAFVLIVSVLSIGACRKEPHNEQIDWQAQGFEVMATTAYCMGQTTANGSKVHEGGCACNSHLGDVAIIYTMDGNYLGMYECNDTGGTEGLKVGNVIDVYRCNLTRCQSYMKITQGKVRVKWVKGVG